MKAWGRAAVAATLVVCALPGMAAASAKMEVQPPTASALISPPKTHGYYLGLTIPNERVAVFYVDRDFDDGFASTAYIVNRRASDPSRMSFSLGPLGHVSLRFVPSGRRRVHRTPTGCHGRPAVTTEGQFRGRIEFRGEGGYVRVLATRAEGEIRRSFRLVCKAGKADHSYSGRSLRQYWGGFPLEREELGTDSNLTALAVVGGHTVNFEATRRFESETGFSAATEDWIGKMLVGRAAFVLNAAAESLVTSEPGQHPSYATVRPPPPFSGEASFFETSQTSHSWTGSLSVSFPGLRLPLTGPGFATSLCRLDLDRSPWGCDGYPQKPVVPERPLP